MAGVGKVRTHWEFLVWVSITLHLLVRLGVGKLWHYVMLYCALIVLQG